ncbi:flagellin [Clostridium butyricum]|uniref:Flagellin n=1 Tax=Clostridium butyricum TaxID=1492 RepID=A0A512TIT9_CLOBU|nr:flagellar protein FlaG [Clostridium butyricum]NOW23166.1 flagellar protein FlaG [Clostridium butyricum]GEQ20106.1 flagellin [Clostridium butyricum]
MDVKNIGQNIINSYNANSNISQYTGTDTDISIPQVQKVETQSSNSNNENKEYSKKDLDDALKKINNFLKDEHTHAEYSYHKELKTMMIKVVDENTKEVLLEIPPKKILDMVASMMKQVGLLDKKA